jgi:hypothetical protein
MAAFVTVTNAKGTGSSLAFSVGTPGAGNALVGSMVGWGTVGTTTFPFTDNSASNVWTTDRLYYPNVAGGDNATSFASSPSVAHVATTVTVTATSGSGLGASSAIVHEFSGMAASGILDVAGNGTRSGTGTTGTTETVTSTNANDVFFALLSVGAAATNPAGATQSGSGWAMPAGSVQDDTSNYAPLAVAYKIVSSTGGQAETFGWTDNNVEHQFLVACYQASAVVPAAIVPPVVLSDNYRVAGWNSGWGR